jgi:hypothetical protein
MLTFGDAEFKLGKSGPGDSNVTYLVRVEPLQHLGRASTDYGYTRIRV